MPPAKDKFTVMVEVIVNEQRDRHSWALMRGMTFTQAALMLNEVNREVGHVVKKAWLVKDE